MKKVLYMLLTVFMLSSVTLTANAYTSPSGIATGGGSSGGGSGGGGGSSGPPPGSQGSASGTVGDDEVDVDINYPFNVYTPKVTYLKSVNAALANYDGAPVYFMPKLEDFPTDLTTTVADLTDGNGVRHRFAAVYDGYFDNDVVYVAAEPLSSDAKNNARIITSKKVYSSEDNSRLLTLLGYDLLLQQEKFEISIEDGNINMSYNPTRVTGTELTAGTAIMDLYKAVGIYEWDIQFAYGVDRGLNVEQSPILQLLPVLTSGEKNKGFDTSESIVWVAATRTNPDQYWNRCLQDAIFDGGLHNVTARNSSYIGSETSVSFTLNKGDNLTLGQFCAVARSIMTLYGEPVMTPAEQEACLLAYGVVLPKGSYSEEIHDSIVYLAAKGIIDPSEKNFNANVTFSDIEDILLRIADEGSRLTIKTENASMLAYMGFSSIDKLTLPGNNAQLNITDAEDLQYRDFLVEVTEDTKYYMTRSTSGTSITSSGSTVNYQPIGTADPDRPWDAVKAQSSENIALRYTGSGSETKMRQQSGYWRNAGIEEYTIDGQTRSFYRFKINPNVFDRAEFVDTETDENNPGTEFTLPDMEGGVYLRNGGSFTRISFEELGFDSTYRDSSSTLFTESGSMFLSSKAQLAGFYFENTAADKAYTQTTYDSGYNWQALYDNNTHVLKMNEKITIANSLQAVVLPPTDADPDMYRLELYGTNIQKVLNSVFISTLLSNGSEQSTSNVGFYRADDNTLLVSTQYLTNAKKISSFEEVDKGIYIMGVRDVAGAKGIDTNVVLYDDDSKGFIMVGDTLYPKQDETLVELVGNTYYVNIKALTGWASDVVLVPTGSAKDAMALDVSNYNTLLKPRGQALQVSTLGYTSTHKLGVLTGVGKVDGVSSKFDVDGFNGKGIMLTSAYSLSNYVLVKSTDAYDYLFVYHIKGQGAAPDLEDDAAARDTFQQLTGFNFESDPDYYMSMYTLDKAAYSENAFSKDRTAIAVNEGEDTLHYVQTTVRSRDFGEVDIEWGWTYSPVKTNNLQDALEKYAQGNNMDYALPFALYKGKWYNLNLSMCKSSPTASSFEPIGTLPAYMFGSTQKSIGKITGASTAGTDVSYSQVPNGNTFSDYKITAAPVGNFSLFKAGVDATVKEVGNNGIIFWGTTELEYNQRSNTCTIGKAPIDLDGDTEIQRTYRGTTLNSAWTVKTATANITKLSDFTRDSLSALFDRDGDGLVDWERYTFNRLVSNLDSWSSILLIFILNILPRVCILLFFCLMLLALIKNVQIWKAFCNRTFDVYKFLTFGHQSVETIDLKRTVLTSIICLALFYIIMDGALFNIILWICEWFLALMQR